MMGPQSPTGASSSAVRRLTPDTSIAAYLARYDPQTRGTSLLEASLRDARATTRANPLAIRLATLGYLVPGVGVCVRGTGPRPSRV